MTILWILACWATGCVGFLLGNRLAESREALAYRTGYRTALVDIDTAAEAFAPDAVIMLPQGVSLTPHEAELFHRAAASAWEAEAAGYNGDSDDD